MEFDRSALLAARTKERGPLALHDATHHRTTAQAGLSNTPVDPSLQLECASHAVRIAEVAQGRSAAFEGARQRQPHGLGERFAARPAESVRTGARIDAGFEQCFAGVNVPGADDDVAAEQRGLDRDASTAQRLVKMVAGERRIERLDAEPGQQLGGRAGIDRRRPDDRAESTRIGQPEGAARRHQIEVVMRPGCIKSVPERERTGHPEMHEQAAPVERQPQVFAASSDRPDLLRDDLARLDAERPAQRFAEAHGSHFCTVDALGKAEPSDLDLGKFGHAGNYPERAESHSAACVTLMDYRVGPHPRNLSMPALFLRFRLARTLVAAAASLALAHGAAAQPTASKVDNSGLDAALFYQLMVGEIELRSGEVGTAYQVLLEAARRTRNEQVFRRATDVALQARAGEQALAAVQAWRIALPESDEALRYQIQLLVALNRANETLEPLTTLLRITPVPQRPALMAALPRLFGRATDRRAMAELLGQALQPYLDAPETRSAAGTALGRSWLAALDSNKALEFARRAHEADPANESPALLALEMLPGTPAAEPIVKGYLQAKPDDTSLRLLYVRSLASSQRYADASQQLEQMTQRDPNRAAPWLTLGALQLEMKRPVEATAALKNYVRLIESGVPVSTDPQPARPVDDDGDEAAPGSPAQALTQAWLLLAQAAEEQRDYAGAEGWLARIDNPQRALEVQLRRASMLARQGKLDEARQSIRRVPEQTQADGRAKLLAEAQLLRDQKAWGEAEKVLIEANQQFADDVDLLYEQAMMAEKTNSLDRMEKLLRKVIELKPDHHHAYNALGYSLAERNVRLPEARELIKKALELSPGEPFITDSLGWVEYRLGNSDEALRLLRGAYQLRPDPEIAAHLGEVLWATGQVEEARRVWREGRSRDSANDVLKETLARLRVEL